MGFGCGSSSAKEQLVISVACLAGWAPSVKPHTSDTKQAILGSIYEHVLSILRYCREVL